MTEKHENLPAETGSSHPNPIRRTMFFWRFGRAFFLVPGVYEEIAADPPAVWQAAAVVCLCTLTQPSVIVDELGAWSIPFILVFSIFFWFLFTGVTYAVSRLLIRGPVDFRRLLRCLGFAQAPAVLNALGPPLVAHFHVSPAPFVWFWLLAATVIAVRASLETDSKRAALISVLAFFLYLSPGIAFGAPVGTDSPHTRSLGSTILAALQPEICAILLGSASVLMLAPFGRLRPILREFPSAARRWIGIASLITILSAVAFYPLCSPTGIGTVDTSELWFPSLFAAHFILAAFLLLWWKLQNGTSLLRFLGLHRITTADIRLGLRAGLTGWFMTVTGMIAVGILFGSWAAEPTGKAAHIPDVMAWLAHLPPWRKLLVVAAAMTVEEAFFRGYLQPRFGWIPSSVLFAMAHAGYGMPTMLVGVFTISLVIGWIFRRTGRLLPCIIAHGVFDGIQIFIIIPLAVQLAAHGGWVVA